MMPPFFINSQMELHTLSADGYDDYGPKEDYALRETVPVDIQPYTPSSSLREFGKILQDTYIVIMDKDTIINETDKIIIEGIRYEMVGSVENWNHSPLAHKKILVQKYRKGE